MGESSGGSGDGASTGIDASSSAGPGTGDAPVWAEIPDQSIEVGVPFELDLAEFVEDPDGDALVFAQVSGDLPDGLTLDGSLISGIPTAVGNFDGLQFSADDGMA